MPGPPPGLRIYLSWGKGTVHEAPEGLEHLKQGEWNRVKIRIGLQIQAGADWSEGGHVRFRNIRLTEL